MSKVFLLGLSLLLSVDADVASAQDRGQDRSQDQGPDRDRALLAAREPAAERWIYSETVSPLDYAPVVIASAWSSDRPDGPALQLSIQCRRGRTDLVIAGPALAIRPEPQRVRWAVDDGPPLMLVATAAPGGTGLAIANDVVRLLAALPANGELAIEVTPPQVTPSQVTPPQVTPQAPPLNGRYALAPLRTVLGRMATPCKWPAQRP